MFTLIFFITLLVSSSVVLFVTRPIAGYANEYYIPVQGKKGITIRYAPVRVAMVVLLLVSFVGFGVTLHDLTH